jgi:hypothetical protein
MAAEGPRWLESTTAGLAAARVEMRATSPSRVLDRHGCIGYRLALLDRRPPALRQPGNKAAVAHAGRRVMRLTDPIVSRDERWASGVMIRWRGNPDGGARYR